MFTPINSSDKLQFKILPPSRQAPFTTHYTSNAAKPHDNCPLCEMGLRPVPLYPVPILTIGPDGHKIVSTMMMGKESYEKMNQYIRFVTRIERKIREAVLDKGHRRVMVSYSNFEKTAEGKYVDNLHKVAFKGTMILVAEPAEHSKGKAYRSEALENPTWLQIAICANRMILRTRNRSHYFLDGFKEIAQSDGVATCVFVMGQGITYVVGQ